MQIFSKTKNHKQYFKILPLSKVFAIFTEQTIKSRDYSCHWIRGLTSICFSALKLYASKHRFPEKLYVKLFVFSTRQHVPCADTFTELALPGRGFLCLPILGKSRRWPLSDGPYFMALGRFLGTHTCVTWVLWPVLAEGDRPHDGGPRASEAAYRHLRSK